MTAVAAPERTPGTPTPAAPQPPEPGVGATLLRGLRLVPEFRAGLGLTLLLALIATAGRVVVPVAVQQTIDNGLGGGGGSADVGLVRTTVLLAGLAVLVTAVSVAAMNIRLVRSTETGLAALRTRAFRHVHDLSVLHQAAERRGSLVARVTSDVDQLSVFMQWGGVLLVVSTGQVLLATVIMLVYSWQLTLAVYLVFLPFVLLVRRVQRRLHAAYGVVRHRVGELLGAVAESVVGAPVLRAYGVEARTAERVDGAIDRHRDSQTRAIRVAALTFGSGELIAGVATSAVLAVGVVVGLGGAVTPGELVAFLFLVSLFVQPVQIGTEVLNEAQNAVAGLRRVLAVLDTPADVPDPADRPDGGRRLPDGPLDVRFRGVAFAYPGGPEVLSDLDVDVAAGSRVAVVGETGSGKTTFAKLLVRLVDPARGDVLVGGVPLRDVRFDSLRGRVAMVPQDGHLFEGTIADNVRYGRPDASDADVEEAFAALGLPDWLATLPDGVATSVGQRGEGVSTGERQLVALARAHVADPDVLVLDEATSAVDPATERRIAVALEGLTTGRTAVTIAHRLSTAEQADDVLVFEAGRLVERGGHAALVEQGGVYARLHRAWTASRTS